MWRLQQHGARLIPPDSCPRGDTKQFSPEGIVKAVTISGIPTPRNGVLPEKLMVAETSSVISCVFCLIYTTCLAHFLLVNTIGMMKTSVSFRRWRRSWADIIQRPGFHYLKVDLFLWSGGFFVCGWGLLGWSALVLP
jgi:hypothetical protein